MNDASNVQVLLRRDHSTRGRRKIITSAMHNIIASERSGAKLLLRVFRITYNITVVCSARRDRDIYIYIEKSGP